MSRVRAKDTRPELAVRRLVYRMGYRYRLHRRDLPGIPDLVFVARRRVIFVHGCFWHRHRGCASSRTPKSRVDFWVRKLDGNRRRDLGNLRTLKTLGWSALVVWECELRDMEKVQRQIQMFLRSGRDA